MAFPTAGAFPLGVSAVGPGESLWPGSPCPFRYPFGTGPHDSEFSHLGVNSDEGLLPFSNQEQLVSPLGPVTWVFYVGVDTFASFDVRPSVKVPVFSAYPSRLGLFPGQVCLNPGNTLDSISQSPYGVPEVLVFALQLGVAQHLGDLARDVLAVRDDVQSALPLRHSVEHPKHFPPLGSLVAPFGGPVSCAQPGVVGGVPPPSPGSYRGAPAAPVSGDHYDLLSGRPLGPGFWFAHL